MIQISNANVSGWEAAIRGMRNPMNSWESSDSKFADLDSELYHSITGYTEKGDRRFPGYPVYSVGGNDMALMCKLAAAGPDHAKFMRMMIVTVDIVAPLYWWKEFDTYKVGTVANSCSTMHKIHAKRFEMNDFSHEHLWDTARMQLEETICVLNNFRDAFNHPGAEGQYKKACWWQMIQLLPSSYNQKRTVLLNYAVLRGIYRSRRNHKLDEWVNFCKWIETLPCHELITGNPVVDDRIS